MLIDHQVRHFHALNEWFQSPQGMCVSKEFIDQLEPVNDYLRGDTLLQLGCGGENPWLNTLTFNKKWLASPFVLGGKIDLLCSLNQIPLPRNSVDCVLAPLILEPFGANFSLIDEIDRILKPMGFVIILSFNPWSLWGGALKMGTVHCYDNRKVKMRTPFSLNRIFLQRGYRQCSLSNFCYIPPVKNQSLLKKLTFFDEVGKMIWPFPSGFYCYIAQKYEHISPLPVVKPVLSLITKEYKAPFQPAAN